MGDVLAVPPIPLKPHTYFDFSTLVIFAVPPIPPHTILCNIIDISPGVLEVPPIPLRPNMYLHYCTWKILAVPPIPPSTIL